MRKKVIYIGFYFSLKTYTINLFTRSTVISSCTLQAHAIEYELKNFRFNFVVQRKTEVFTTDSVILRRRFFTIYAPHIDRLCVHSLLCFGRYTRRLSTFQCTPLESSSSSSAWAHSEAKKNYVGHGKTITLRSKAIRSMFVAYCFCFCSSFLLLFA